LTTALCWKWLAREDEPDDPCELAEDDTEVLRPVLGNSAGSLPSTPPLLDVVTDAVDTEALRFAGSVF
jgi:hypothetical protein